jgi:hypothetical protein
MNIKIIETADVKNIWSGAKARFWRQNKTAFLFVIKEGMINS